MHIETQWWELKGEELANGVVDAAHDIEDRTLERQQILLDASSLYGDLTSWSGHVGITRRVPSSRRVSHNVISNAVDALVSEITQTQPRPMFVTIGGTWGERNKAKKLTSYMDSKFSECDLRTLAPQAARDSILGGLGALRPYINRQKKRVEVERIWPGNIIIDDAQCVDVHPRELYLRRFMDRFHMMDLYPKHRAAIEQAEPPDDRFYWSNPNDSADTIEVIEAWHLSPTGKGLHVIAMRGTLLVAEAYDREHFPLAFIRAVLPEIGFWGDSLVMRASSAQRELNKLLRRVQDSMHLHAVPRIFMQPGSFVKSHMQNDVGNIVEVTGQPPVFLTPPSMSGEVYDHIDRLTRWIYDEMGVSQMSATSLKPRGITSGTALDTYNDVQSRRFINFERAYERMHVDLAREIARLEGVLAEADPSHEVVHDLYGAKQRIPWRAINLDEQRMRVDVFPVSEFTRNPAHKLELLEKMLERGTIDERTFWQQLDVPDFEAVRNSVVAPSELLEQRFDKMLDGGEYEPPEPYMDLMGGMKLASLQLQEAEKFGCPDERCELLRNWITDAQALLERAQQQQAAEAMEMQATLAAEHPMPPAAPPPAAPPADMGPPMPPMPPPDMGPPPGGFN